MWARGASTTRGSHAAVVLVTNNLADEHLVFLENLFDIIII